MGYRRLNIHRLKQRLAELNLTEDGFKNDVPLDRRTVERLLSGATRQPQPATVQILAEFLGLPPVELLQEVPSASAAPSSPRHIDVHLPVTGSHLLGRSRELACLDHQWSQPQTTICSIVAWGGVGKSALVAHWLAQLSRDGWRGAERVFGWTFAGQGGGAPVASVDGFLEAALRFFGDPQPGLSLPEDTGARLAELVRARRTLLVLDGLEPYQCPPELQGLRSGELRDPALAALLRGLALHNPGLCVITTRQEVADIAAFRDTTAVLRLNTLSEEAGAALFEALGCTGSVAERQAAVRECGGHALTLQLVGSYLRDVCGGDVRRRHEVLARDQWSREGGQAWGVMASYERWFGPGPEVAVLRLLGLFDGPARAEALAALRAAPAIPALNEALLDLTESQWQLAIGRLRAAGLLTPADPARPQSLDTHPLVRAYYRHRLRAQAPEAWRAGHERLFAHLQESVLEPCPTLLEALLPLYAAVAHGCLAGHTHDALQVLRQRIRRGVQSCSLPQGGAFGIELATLAHGFTALWSAVVPGLPAADQLLLFHTAGECLNALGRVYEAETPLQRALALALAQQPTDWSTAALAAARLSEVYRAQGKLKTARCYAQRGAEYARHRGVPLLVQVLCHAFYGFALYWVGQADEALKIFQRAEKVQKRAQRKRPRLHAVLGYMYGELLLDRLADPVSRPEPARFREAWKDLRERIAQAFDYAQQDRLPRDMGLQHVSMGRLYTLAWQHHALLGVDPEEAQDKALNHLMQAVESLDLSQHQNYLPRALLTRATLYRLQGQFGRAHADVDATLAMAQRGAMEVYQVEAYGERAAIFLAQYRATPVTDHLHRAEDSLHTARQLIDRMQYARRGRQVEELEAELPKLAVQGSDRERQRPRLFPGA